MRHSLWMLNSALALFCLGVVVLLFVTRPTVAPRRALIVAAPTLSQDEQASPKIDLATIYEKDPFGTLSAGPEQIKPAQPRIEQVPLPPVQPQNIAPVQQQPQFLPPLNILLKGVIFSENDQSNRAIIADKKTKTELLYKVGDPILDAEIIRIESNKIILLRSNGQQETVFASPLDAHNDPLYQQLERKASTLAQAIRQQGPLNITIDPVLFTETITNLAQFIEQLDITTVYEHGRGIGCRVGVITPGSLGALLGLQTNDIITRINNIPTGIATDRLAAYEQIRRLRPDESITVHLLRNQKQIQITYTLTSFTAPKRTVPTPQQPQPQRPTAPIQQQFTTNPTPIPYQQVQPINRTGLSQLQKTEKPGIFENGGRSGMLRSTKP